MAIWSTMRSMLRRAAPPRRNDAALLAAMPDYMLYDIGVSPDGIPSLARQVRREAETRVPLR